MPMYDVRSQGASLLAGKAQSWAGHLPALLQAAHLLAQCVAQNYCNKPLSFGSVMFQGLILGWPWKKTRFGSVHFCMQAYRFQVERWAHSYVGCMNAINILGSRAQLTTRFTRAPVVPPRCVDLPPMWWRGVLFTDLWLLHPIWRWEKWRIYIVNILGKSWSLQSLCDKLIIVLPSLHTSAKHTGNSYPKVKKMQKIHTLALPNGLLDKFFIFKI